MHRFGDQLAHVGQRLDLAVGRVNAVLEGPHIGAFDHAGQSAARFGCGRTGLLRDGFRQRGEFGRGGDGGLYAALRGTRPSRPRTSQRGVQAAIAATPELTPLAKAIAKETGAAAPEAGSGLAGMVKGADMGALKNSVYATDSEIKPLTNMRKLIAKAMHASLQNSAQLTHHLSADARRILELRKKVKKAVDNGYPTNITLNDMVCMAVIKALKKFPQVDSRISSVTARAFSRKSASGLAVDTDRGLMVPTVKNAERPSDPGPRQPTQRGCQRLQEGLDRSRPALFRSSIVHRIEPRQLRRRDLYPRDQPAAGGRSSV